MERLAFVRLERLKLRAIFELGAHSKGGACVEKRRQGSPGYHCGCMWRGVKSDWEATAQMADGRTILTTDRAQKKKWGPQAGSINNTRSIQTMEKKTERTTAAGEGREERAETGSSSPLFRLFASGQSGGGF